MHVSKPLLALLVYSLGVFAAPVTDVDEAVLAGGSGDSEKDPIQAELEVKGQSKLPFEADFWAILCKNKPRTLQHVIGSEDTKNRGKSGASKNPGPFKDPNKYKIKKLPAQKPSWNKQPFDSPEEYPFASTSQGGTNALLIPVNRASQSSQGGVISGYYKKKIAAFDPANPKNTKRTWYKISKFIGDLGPYCKALEKGDTSVCKKDTQGPWGFDVANYAYTL